MATRSEDPDEVVKRIMNLPQDEDHDGHRFSEKLIVSSEEFWRRCKAEPGDTVLKLMDEYHLFES